MNKKLYDIYMIFKDKKIHTSNEISEIIKLSNKTTRILIKQLKEILKENNMEIISIPSKGYHLVGEIVVPEKIFNISNINIPITQTERINYLIEKLVFDSEYIKIEEISKSIFSSTRTISIDIKNIKEMLKLYNLKLVSKPYYGLRIDGRESDIRRFLIFYIENKLNENIFKNINNEILEKISKYTLEFTLKENITLSDISFFNLVISVYTTLERIKKNRNIEDDILYSSFISKKEEQIVKYVKYLEKEFLDNKKISLNEIKYISMHFTSKETINSIENINSKEIDNLIKDIFKYIEITFNVKVKNKEELYKNLYAHLIPLSIRLRFGIKLKNPLLNDIKKNMSFSYNIAVYISNLISRRNNNYLSEDEIGYIAVIIEMGIDYEDISKKRVLIVCPTGRGTSKFLKSYYKKIFKDSISIIDTSGIKDLDFLDLKKYDLIFSITEIEKDYGVNIIRVSTFLDEKEIDYINKLLKKKFEVNFFDKDLFVVIKEKLNKQEILEKLCELIKNKTNTNVDILSLILEREKLGYTELFNKVAIPHPIKGGYKFQKIAVAVLENPIVWNKNEISLILMICVDNIEKFNDEIYRNIGNLINSESKLKKFLEKPSYEILIKLLEEK